ncbi:secondary thiamine-phosphate synthase enzyme YjbQ [Paraglaciecola aquimarina]|uniref:Secondary thiamine-phosphate synthase enzyme YjbQ n=1 Tax=Paraglaciecola aquimarina TaxID=1235557 RepID=A0ABU3SSZ7_9ALTE|nr:secondary thiamine-phosphate synthase enzyme YjbQ [Paraglaciecola aquimarina]MDU0353141.1 secondary thiamine-phosphate synthase enzyme YjbQ [Paraglaciecola aquimarina]
MWTQQRLILAPRTRGYHLITDEVVNQLKGLEKISTGLLHLFIQHTSASLTINENADPTVRADMETHINKMVPENMAYYLHNYEGDDDMPAHIKASLLGNNLTIPICNGALALGMWQGIILGEHRNQAGSRHLIATLSGQT